MSIEVKRIVAVARRSDWGSIEDPTPAADLFDVSWNEGRRAMLGPILKLSGDVARAVSDGDTFDIVVMRRCNHSGPPCPACESAK